MSQRLALCVVLLFLGTGRAFGQAGEIKGTVTDHTGGVVPGAIVTLSIGDVRRSVTTGAGGDYRFTAVAPGKYELSVLMPGFAVAKRSNIVVEGDAITVWAQNKTLSDAARRQLEQLRDLENQLASVNAEMSTNDSSVASITRDEDRARQNITSLSSVSGQQQQVQTYARQLSELESKITVLRDRHGELEKQKTSLQAQIDGAIEKISF